MASEVYFAFDGERLKSVMMELLKIAISNPSFTGFPETNEERVTASLDPGIVAGIEDMVDFAQEVLIAIEARSGPQGYKRYMDALRRREK